MYIKISIDTSFAAFEDPTELGRILDKAASKLYEPESGLFEVLTDSNGNTVGNVRAED